MTRYTTEVLEDARVFADHAAKTDVELDDVQLSLHAKTSEEYPQQPSVDVPFCFPAVFLHINKGIILSVFFFSRN